MSPTVEELATRFNSAADEMGAITERCSEVQLRQLSVSEGWPLAVVAHHVAVVNQAFAGMVEKFVNGETYSPTISMDTVHETNAKHARDYADVGKHEVLEKLRDGQSAVSAALVRLDDSQLESPAGVYGGNPLTVLQVIEYIVIGHTAEHLQSMKATLNGATP